MSARTPNPFPATKIPLPNSILAIQPDDLSLPQNESYTVALSRHDEKPEIRTGLDLKAIGDLAAAQASGSLVAAYGPDDHLAERLWRIAAGIDAVVLDVRLLARILLPGLRDYERATVERCVDPAPAESGAGAARPAESGADDARPAETGAASPVETGAGGALKTAELCRALLDLLASQDPETKETLILLAEGTGSGLERLLARMAARTAGRGDAASHVDHSDRSAERPPITDTALGPSTIGDGACDATEADDDLDLMDTDIEV